MCWRFSYCLLVVNQPFLAEKCGIFYFNIVEGERVMFKFAYSAMFSVILVLFDVVIVSCRKDRNVVNLPVDSCIFYLIKTTSQDNSFPSN